MHCSVLLQCFSDLDFSYFGPSCCTNKVDYYLSLKGKARRRTKPKAEDKDKDSSPEIVDVEREKAAGQVWVADCEGEIVGCVSREGDCRLGMRRFCRVVVGCWYRVWSRGRGRRGLGGSMPTSPTLLQ